MKFNKKLKPLFNPPENVRYIIVTGGRFSSKSYSASTAVCSLINNENRKALYTRYTLTSAKDSIIPEFSEKIDLLGLSSYYQEKQDRITGVGNREVVFKGLKTSSGNQTAKLKSLKGFSIFVLDEAEEENDETAFDKINLSIREPVQNLAILILNPTTKEHWIYKRFFESKGVKAGFNGVKDNVCYIHTTYLDVIEHVPKDFLYEVEDLKKTNPKKYNHVIMGGWLEKADGVIFDKWEYGDFPDTQNYIYGMDFGFFPDPDVLVKVSLDAKRKLLFVKQVFEANNKGTEELGRLIKTHKKDGKVIVADSAEKRLISDIRKYANVQPCEKGAGSILEGIKLMQDFKIIVDPSSTEIGTEFNNYCWSDKKSGVPIDAYNHRIDAIRYAVRKLIKGNINISY